MDNKFATITFVLSLLFFFLFSSTSYSNKLPAMLYAIFGFGFCIWGILVLLGKDPIISKLQMPGWNIKLTGVLLIVVGIFMLNFALVPILGKEFLDLSKK